jgi:L-2-hydroxyglutarate oxidase LhgO
VSDDEFEVVVVGAGLVGLATAMTLLRERPGLRLAVLEKEDRIAVHQSGHNSGVLHAGLYYAPGSLKARLCREGRSALIEFADRHGIPYRISGKLVVAADESERTRFEHLLERGRENGLTIRRVDRDECAELEPNVRGVDAFHVAESGVIDYPRVAETYARAVVAAGGSIRLGSAVRRIENGRIHTHDGTVAARLVVACAGLQSDRVAALGGAGSREIRIVPFRGDYYTFRPESRELVNGIVYPVPDPTFPFLGVHFTRGVDGGLTAGPNAVPTAAREGYRRAALNVRDLRDVVAYPGFWRLARTYLRTGAAEIWRDLVKSAYVKDMQRYVPAVTAADVTFGPSGVRAQCLSRDGSMVDDFVIEETATGVYVLNAPSPAATASLAIGREIAARVTARLA